MDERAMKLTPLYLLLAIIAGLLLVPDVLAFRECTRVHPVWYCVTP